MCEIFPEVEKCCLFINLRLGMLFISVLCIMTGVTLLCVVEQRANANFKNLQHITEIDDPKKAVSKSHLVVITGLTLMAFVFVFTGSVLMFATLTDQEGLVQVFVWMMFLNIMLGFFLTLAVGIDCLTRPGCFLAGMDWLSGSASMVLFVAYLFLWLYFVMVANSYVLNVYA